MEVFALLLLFFAEEKREDLYNACFVDNIEML